MPSPTSVKPSVTELSVVAATVRSSTVPGRWGETMICALPLWPPLVAVMVAARGARPAASQLENCRDGSCLASYRSVHRLMCQSGSRNNPLLKDKTTKELTGRCRAVMEVVAYLPHWQRGRATPSSVAAVRQDGH